MHLLDKKDAEILLDTLLAENKNLPKELMDKFKKDIIELVLNIQKAIEMKFKDDIVAEEATIKFFERSENKFKYIMESELFLKIDVPVIIPIEVFTMASLLSKRFLLLSLLNITQTFVHDTVTLITSSSVEKFKEEIALLKLMQGCDTNIVN